MPLCVDLDGTLLRGDLLLELVFVLLRRRPWVLPLLPFWLARGRQHLKARLAERGGALIDVASLPYDEELLAYLRAERAAGRPVELVSASHHSLVRRVADHLGCFDEVFGTDECNLKGRVKADWLGGRHPTGFVYAGDSRADMAVWERAVGAIPVGPALARKRRIASLAPIERSFGEAPDLMRLLPRAMRVHQWAKNALLFLPLLLTHGLGAPGLYGATLMAFLAFSLVASATYIVNDLMDLAADRSHPTKRHRPIASGKLPMPVAGASALGLFVAGAALAVPLGAGFGFCLLLYVGLTLSYSFGIKAVAIADVLTLGALFTLRLLAGHSLIDGGVPAWLLVFSMFFFTSLALVKRYTEVRGLEARGIESIPGRGYRAGDGQFVLILGMTLGVASIVVFMLYLVAEPLHVQRLGAPERLWVVPATLAVWLPRVWLLAVRGEMHDDPVVFALRDRASLALGGIALIAVLAAS